MSWAIHINPGHDKPDQLIPMLILSHQTLQISISRSSPNIYCLIPILNFEYLKYLTNITNV